MRATIFVLFFFISISSFAQLGIGISNPTEMLDVNGNIKASATVKANDASVTNGVTAKNINASVTVTANSATVTNTLTVKDVNSSVTATSFSTTGNSGSVTTNVLTVNGAANANSFSTSGSVSAGSVTVSGNVTASDFKISTGPEAGLISSALSSLQTQINNLSAAFANFKSSTKILSSGTLTMGASATSAKGDVPSLQKNIVIPSMPVPVTAFIIGQANLYSDSGGQHDDKFYLNISVNGTVISETCYRPQMSGNEFSNGGFTPPGNVQNEASTVLGVMLIPANTSPNALLQVLYYDSNVGLYGGSVLTVVLIPQ